ncbi:MAG: C40 family peptidase [Lachnospiraceae bacterium]|nr:C40 family peptidase [Lachnospiraceae bacterium]
MMKKAVMQFTACCVAAGIAVSSFSMAALADNSGMTLAGLSEKNTVVVSTTLAGLSETDSVIVVKGTASTAEASATESADDTSETAAETSADTTAETAAETAAETSADTADASADETEAAAEETETETETELVYDTSMSGQTAFGQCDNYINVRSEASADSEVVGKIYNNNSVTILGQLGDWYEIQSGNVTGYVNAAYIATGEEASAIAEETAYNVATVNAEGLWVHTEASEDSETIAMVYYSDQMEVVAYEGDWMKVVLEDGTYGYVNAWYVDYDSYYSTGETLEEEQERLDEQWLAYLAEQEAAAEAAAAEAAAAEAAAAAAAEATAATTTTTETTTSSSTSLSDAQSAVDAAYQTYLDAQEAADEATHQADEQLVYDTYDAAVAAYQDYLNAVAEADEIKYSSSASETTSLTSETTTTTETASTEATTTTTETTATEAAQTEAAQTETAATEAQTEAAATTTTTTTSSSSSSTGQSIANYAVQFVGNPYVYGGTSLTNGADCSGFTQSVFAHFGISISRTAASQASGGTSVSLSDIQPGDLLFYSNGGSISHVALYIGNGQIVHASTSSTGIIISNYNYRTPVCARRYWS